MVNIPSLSSLLEDYNEWKVKLRFGSSSRIEFYEALSILIGNGVQLIDALGEMYNVASQDGKKPNAPQAIIYAYLIDGMRGGARFSMLLRKYVNYEECSLIAGGEKSGEMEKAFEFAVRVITKKREIVGAVAMATVYPAILAGMLMFLVNMVSTKLVPKFSRMSNPDTWEGNARIIYLMGEFVTNHGGKALVACGMFLVLLAFSFPYLRGPVRIYLDRVFPWSLYRMLYGSTFLLNVSVMISSGVQLRDALESLAKNTNPWLRERIEGALYGTGIGANLGVALKNSGYEFPDRRAVRYLEVLANQEGFEKAIARFGERWMDESVKQAKTIGRVALGVGIAIIGALMLLIISGANEITETIQAGAR